MALVRITRGLLYRVRTHIDDMRDRDTAAYETDVNDPLLLSGEEPWLYQAVWGEHMHLKDVVPKDWVRMVDQADLHAQIENRMSFVVGCRFANKLKMPPNSGHYHRPDIYIRDVLPDEMKPLVDKAVKRTEVHAQWELNKTHVVTFLEQCKSVNEALKLWPNVRAYLPESALTKVGDLANRPTKLSSAAEYLATLDTDRLTAAAVGARLTTR